MRLCAPLALLAVLAASSSSAQTARITARLVAKPADLSAGIAWTARVRLAQNGHELSGAKAVLTARNVSRARRFALRETRMRGTHAARVRFPTAGRWALAVRVRRTVVRLGSITVGPRRPDVRRPFDVAVAPNGWLAVADRDADRVLLVDPRTGAARVAASGLDDPIAVAYDRAGALYANSGEQILRLDDGGGRTVIAGTGTRGHSGDGGPAAAARLGGVGAFAFAATGELYVPEYDNWVRLVRANGIIETIAGTGTEGSAGDGGPARLAAIAAPHALAVGADGSVMLADSHNGRIRRITPAGVMTTLADGFAAPVSIGSAPDGSFVVGDAGTNLLERVLPDGNRIVLASGLRIPSGIAVDSNGNVFFSEFDASRVRRLDPRTRRITTVAR